MRGSKLFADWPLQADYCACYRDGYRYHACFLSTNLPSVIAFRDFVWIGI
jgi:hypothetical protein